MHTYYITFVNPRLKSETYTVGERARAPRLAVRNARRKLANQGITGLHASDCWRYVERDVRKDGVVRYRILRFALSWKF